jgi:hypothetical protein
VTNLADDPILSVLSRAYARIEDPARWMRGSNFANATGVIPTNRVLNGGVHPSQCCVIGAVLLELPDPAMPYSFGDETLPGLLRNAAIHVSAMRPGTPVHASGQADLWYVTQVNDSLGHDAALDVLRTAGALRAEALEVADSLAGSTP